MRRYFGLTRSPAGLFVLLFSSAAALVPVAGALQPGAPERMIIAPESYVEGALPHIRVLESTDDRIELEFSLSALTVVPVDIEGGIYHLLEIEGGGQIGSLGEPMLPTFSRLVQLPDRSGVRIEVLGVETIEVADLRPFPVQAEDGTSFVVHRESYDPDRRPVPDPWVVCGAPALARGMRVASLAFQPVRFDPRGGNIEIAQTIRVEVHFDAVDLRATPRPGARPLAPSFERLFRNVVLNYTAPRQGAHTLRGIYVLICQDDPDVITALRPLVDWRTRQGFAVTLATTTETGSTAQEIKDWLQEAYDTWEHAPEYITLVGDPIEGDFPIPCWYETYTGYNGETDHPYVQLDGDDILPDAHVGRISVPDLEHLQLYVLKMVGYESAPYMGATDWYTRACLVGDPTDSGPTCIQVMQWLKVRMIEWGYAEIDTFFTHPAAAAMAGSINEGVGVFSYRGFYGMSGFNAGHILALENIWMLPFAVNLTCDTGSFSSGTARSEAWILAGLPPDIPTGGIASIGTATVGTHTRFNNCVTYGIWRGVFWDDMFHFGEALTRAKFELYINYWDRGPNYACAFTCWNNLMGDVAGELWTGLPQDIVVDHPDTVALGANVVAVSVREGVLPCAGAYVCLWKEGEVHAGGVTDESGVAEIFAAATSPGEMLVTVTKHDCRPYLAELTVQPFDLFVGYAAHAIDDDASGSSMGNGDGLPNPAEWIELPVEVHNSGTLLAAGLNGTLTCEDPYIVLHDDAETFGDLGGGSSAWCADDFDFEIAPGTPDGHILRFGLDLSAGEENWHSLIEVPVVAPAFIYDSLLTYGFSGQIDPGESGEIGIRIVNHGSTEGRETIGHLVSGSAHVVLTDSVGSFGTIVQGGMGTNSTDRFGITVSSQCFEGYIAPMTLFLECQGGIMDTVFLALQIGTAYPNDPTGPDAHGYIALDDTDTTYPDAPVYDWVETDPTYGGLGTIVELSDYAFGADDSRTVTLPFEFRYYGETFTQATICSNGWIAMGTTSLVNCRNWNIPAAGAPPYLIAPMWDNLYLTEAGRVYHWYDADHHRYIVQWSHVLNNSGATEQNFEVILLDPAYYGTETGDGIILFQYDIFHNNDNLQHYATIGIENGDQTDGLMYGYYNFYNAGGTTVTSGRAIKFLPHGNLRMGVLAGTVINATSGGVPLGGAIVRVLEEGTALTAHPDGSYAGSVRPGIYTVAASHPAFAPDTLSFVSVVAEETTILDFSLVDVTPPFIYATTEYPPTVDEQGPYEITTRIIEPSDLEGVWLYYNADETGWQAIPCQRINENRWGAGIPGHPRPTHIRYYVEAADVGGHLATDPPDDPIANAYEFWVMPPILIDEMENPEWPIWSHEAVSPGHVDQWHRSSRRNHTPGGAWSWKLGDAGSGTYADSCDAVLITPPIPAESSLTLVFWHWMESDYSTLFPGYGYDGGIVEMSLDDGPWEMISPRGGYPLLVRNRYPPGPFPAEMPFYSGDFDWTEAVFEIPECTGEVRFRFHFGSDWGGEYEGWYIDDIIVFGPEPYWAGLTEHPSPLPTRLALYANHPNPAASDGTVIRFDLPQRCRASLRVYDINGRMVRSLAEGDFSAGEHRLLWDGRDDERRNVSDAVYFYRLRVGSEVLTRKLLLIR